MQFMISLSSSTGADWVDLEAAKRAMHDMIDMLETLTPGEAITVKRVS